MKAYDTVGEMTMNVAS